MFSGLIGKLIETVGKVFRSKYINAVASYFCLLTAISVVSSAFVVLLQQYGYFIDMDMTYIIGVKLFGNGYLSLVYLGLIVFRRNFCSWSKLSWIILLLYYSVYALHVETGLILSIYTLVALNLVLAVLLIFVLIDLYKSKLKVIK